MTTEAGDFWYRAARHTDEKDAEKHYTQLAHIAAKCTTPFTVLIFQSPDDFSYYTIAVGNLSPQARERVKSFFRGSSITLSTKNLTYVRKLVAEQQRGIGVSEQRRKQLQRFELDRSAPGELTSKPEKDSAGREHPRELRVAQPITTVQDNQNFHEKKEQLLRRVQAGTATQAQKDWLARWGFLGQPEPQQKSEPQSPNSTYPGSPTKIGPAYRYRGPMKATPVAKLEGPGGPGTHRNRYGKLVASKKGQGGKRRSVFVKYQSMR